MIHPLGQLASLAADATEWRARTAGRAATWAGLWPTALSSELIAQVLAHARRPDAALVQRLARRGAFGNVRNFALLLAILPLAPLLQPSLETTETTGDEDEDEELSAILPIWHHGIFAQATLNDVRQAKHIVRVLDDYHEPTLAALRRQRLRALSSAAERVERQAAGAAAAEAFLTQPVRWRDVVERAVHQSTLRALEHQLGERVLGPRRTPADLAALVAVALDGLRSVNGPNAAEANQAWQARLASLTAASVMLLYEEHTYLQLAGVQAGRSVQQYLPRGLHLAFSDQEYRRADRTAGLWLEQSAPEQNTDAYYWAEEIPPAYAERKREPLFRLADADAVRRYGMD